MPGHVLTVKAIYENGVFRHREPVHFAERTEVEALMPDTTSPDLDDPTGWKVGRSATRTLRGSVISSTARSRRLLAPVGTGPVDACQLEEARHP